MKNSNSTNGRRIDANPQGFVVSFPYDADLVAAVKEFEGRRYEPGSKSWTVPLRHAAEVAQFAEERSFVFTDAGLRALQKPDVMRPVVEGDVGVAVMEGRFYVKFKYDKEQVETVKKIDGRRWHPDEKMWSIPFSSVRAFRGFCEEFCLPTDVLVDVPDSDPVVEPEISKVANGYQVRFPYDRDLVQRVREIPTARFDRQKKVWFVENSAKEDLVDFAEETSAILESAIEVSFSDMAGRRRRYKMSLATESDLDIPSLQGTLKGFQKAGIRFGLEALGFARQGESWARMPEHSKRGVLIGDEQGLGKTVQALGILEAASAFPAVVVAPTSVRLNWQREIKRWLPHRSVEVAYGVEATDVSADIVVIGWDTLHGWSGTIPVLAAVFDEAHYAKSPESRRTKAALALAQRASEAGGFVLALTGTPMLNRPAELKSQFEIIGRLEELGGSRGFDAAYVRNKEPDLAGLNRRMRETCFLRRLKKDVMSELGEKEFVSILVSGDTETMDSYRLAEAGLREELGEELRRAIEMAAGSSQAERDAAGLKAFRQTSGAHLAKIEYLRQLAARAKREAIGEWLEDFLSTEKKVVVFGWHREDVEWVASRFGEGLKIIGGMNDKDKQDAVERFQTNDDERVIACSLKAAGVGITLTAASDVLFIEQGWTPADMDQAADRCHRIGQRDSVTVYTLLCEDTIDLRIAELIERKRRIVDAVVDSRDSIDDFGSIAGAVIEQYAREGWRPSVA